MPTKKINTIIPEVMRDFITAKINALCKITKYAHLDTSLVGVAGDKVTVPSWRFIGSAEDVAEGNSVSDSTLIADSSQFTIKKAMKSVSLTAEVLNSAGGNPSAQAETQLAKAVAVKIDNDLLACALTSSNIVDKTSTDLGYNEIVDAVTKFEDEEDDIEKVMFIHPNQEATLLKDSNFISADKFQAGVAVNGSIGKIAGCWIKKSSKITKVNAVTAVTAVAGVYAITIGTKATANDRLKINNVELIAGSTDWSLTTDTATGNATALASALNASTDESVKHFTWSSSAGVLSATEDTGYEGKLGIPTILVTKGVSGTLVATIATTTAGVEAVTAVPAHYVCPIIKLEPDSEETEATEGELPALTIFLKADTELEMDKNIKTQTTDLVVTKHYGVALTNAGKVVLLKVGA